ncbi:MAG: tetratricopeptide repeat protein [Thermoguttaceae bacterium]
MTTRLSERQKIGRLFALEGVRLRRVASLAAAALLIAASSLVASPAPPLTLDDQLKPLKPRHAATEADRDRIEAIALFAAGRSAEGRERYVEALRDYQRAVRRDPRSLAATEAAILTAVRLERFAEAARYILAAPGVPQLPTLVIGRLVIHLADAGNIDQALSLYEKTAAVQPSSKPTATDILLRMEMGQLYVAREKPNEAAKCFAAVLRALDDPNASGVDDGLRKTLLAEPGPTYQMIGDCLLAAGRLAEAEDCFQKSDKIVHNEATRLLNRARVAAKKGNAADALKLLDAALAKRLDDGSIAACELLCNLLEKLGEKEKIVGRLETLRAADPKNPAIGYFLARRYTSAGVSDKAERLYRELADAAPTLTAYRELIDLYRRGKQFDAVLDTLAESVENIGRLETLDSVVQSLKPSPELAREVAVVAKTKLRDGRKFDANARLAVALLALEAKQYDTANEFFKLTLEAKPKQADEVYLIWGVGLLASDRLAEAAKAFQQAIDAKAAPEQNPTYHFYLAGVLALEGRIDDALDAAHAAADKKKDGARFVARPAWVLYLGKRYAEAEKAYRDLLDRFDADRKSAETRDVLREARLSLSNLAVIRGDFAAAEEWLEQVLDEFPDDVGAMNDLAYLWVDRNEHLDRSERMIRRALAAEPDNRAYRDSLGWLLFRRGQYGQAVVELEKAVADGKPDGTVFDHLGDAYLKLKQRDKAVAAWRKAADAFRQDKETDKVNAAERKLREK